jgi:transposase
MVREHVPDYEAEHLIGYRLEDFVDVSHISRFVREFVSTLDLEGLGFRAPTARFGRKPFGRAAMLSAWLYGCLVGFRSTRALERACSNDMGALWLTGNLQPDHATLWEFWTKHSVVIRKLMKETSLTAARLGLLGLELVAADGTKLRASASDKRAWSVDELSKWAIALEAQIEAYAKDVNDAGDAGCASIPEALQDREGLRKAIVSTIEQMKELGVTRLSPTDDDARTMKTSSGKKLAYNLQAVVDSKSGIVVAFDVSQEASDAELLNHMIDLVEETIGLSPNKTVADTGYFSSEQIALARQADRSIVVGVRGREPGPNEPLHSWLFEKKPGEDALVCPIGGELTYYGSGKSHGSDVYLSRYHCTQHWACPFADQCSTLAKGRIVEATPHRDSMLRQWKEQQNPECQEILNKLRGAIVERIFGYLKRTFGLRHLEHRGLESVKTVCSLALTTANLRTIYKYWKPGMLKAAQAG